MLQPPLTGPSLGCSRTFSWCDSLWVDGDFPALPLDLVPPALGVLGEVASALPAAPPRFWAKKAAELEMSRSFTFGPCECELMTGSVLVGYTFWNIPTTHLFAIDFDVAYCEGATGCTRVCNRGETRTLTTNATTGAIYGASE